MVYHALTLKNGRFKYASGNAIFKDDDKTATLLCSNFTNNNEDLEHRITFLDRNEKWDSSVPDISLQGDNVSKIVGYCLASSVANSAKNAILTEFEPKPNIDQIIIDAKQIMEETYNPFFNKIGEEMCFGKNEIEIVENVNENGYEN